MEFPPCPPPKKTPIAPEQQERAASFPQAQIPGGSTQAKHPPAQVHLDPSSLQPVFFSYLFSGTHVISESLRLFLCCVKICAQLPVPLALRSSRSLASHPVLTSQPKWPAHHGLGYPDTVQLPPNPSLRHARASVTGLLWRPRSLGRTQHGSWHTALYTA